LRAGASFYHALTDNRKEVNVRSSANTTAAAPRPARKPSPWSLRCARWVGGKTSALEQRYYIASCEMTSEAMAKAIRAQ